MRHATSAAGRVAPGESGESGDEPSLDIKREPVPSQGRNGWVCPHARTCMFGAEVRKLRGLRGEQQRVSGASPRGSVWRATARGALRLARVAEVWC